MFLHILCYFSLENNSSAYCPWPPCYSHIQLSLEDLFDDESAQKLPETFEIHSDESETSNDSDQPCTNQQISDHSDQTVVIVLSVFFVIIVVALFILLPKWKPGWPRYLVKILFLLDLKF